MEAVPDDLFQHDMHTFPRDDPAVLAKQAQVNAAAEKEIKAREAAEAKERKKDEAMVKKALAPVKKDVPHDNARKCQLMAHKIRLYYKKLPHCLSSKEPKTLPKDEEGLAELLAAIETELHSKGGIEMAGKLTIGVCTAVEQLNQQFNPFGLMLSGPAASFTMSVQANRKDWDDLMTEFAISNAELFCVSLMCSENALNVEAAATFLQFFASLSSIVCVCVFPHQMFNSNT